MRPFPFKNPLDCSTDVTVLSGMCAKLQEISRLEEENKQLKQRLQTAEVKVISVSLNTYFAWSEVQRECCQQTQYKCAAVMEGLSPTGCCCTQREGGATGQIVCG